MLNMSRDCGDTACTGSIGTVFMPAYMYVESLYSPSIIIMFLMGSFSFCLTYFVEIIVILLYIDVATININYS